VRFFYEAMESAKGRCGIGVRADSIGSSPGGERPGPEPLAAARLVSIGPVTSDALRARGLEPDVEASRHDIDGLVEALLADAAR
jgi:hypothetical protein